MGGFIEIESLFFSFFAIFVLAEFIIEMIQAFHLFIFLILPLCLSVFVSELMPSKLTETKKVKREHRKYKCFYNYEEMSSRL